MGVRLALAAAAGSALLLIGAFVFQALGYLPCQLCLWQRWPHATAVAAGAALLVLPWVLLMVAGFLSAITTAGIGIYHTGVENAWWPGPAGCAGGGMDLTQMGGADLLSTDGPTGVIMCDEVAWAFMGVSMASWNALFSIGLAVLWAVALRRRLSAG
ncbi:MAG: disulfide bond formation protein B [Pseudomonadota bacterium]